MGASFGEFEFQYHSKILQTLIFTLGVNPSGITKKPQRNLGLFSLKKMFFSNMMSKLHNKYRGVLMNKEPSNILKESSESYITNVSDNERLRRDVFRSDMDKLKLFTKMLRTNNVLNKAVVTHK
jgi:hypothetical protein